MKKSISLLLLSLLMIAPGCQKTKEVVKVLGNIKCDNALIVMDGSNENVMLSARNIPAVKTASVNTINVYDLLKYNNLVVTKEAVEKIQEVYA